MDAVESIELGKVVGEHGFEFRACFVSRGDELSTVPREEEPVSERRLKGEQSRQIRSLPVGGVCEREGEEEGEVREQ